MMEALYFILGVIIGVVAVGLAFELGMRRASKEEPTTRPTHKWNINEIANPRIVAENLGDIEVPRNARMVVSEYPSEALLQGLNVKQHSGIRGNYILGDDRALILSGPMKQGELGVWTVEKEMLQKLNKYFEESWEKATPLNEDETTQ